MTVKHLAQHTATVQSLDKVSGHRARYCYRRPWLSLCAKWLADAGFSEGDRVVIHSYPDALIITKQENGS